MSESPIRLRGKSGGVVFDGTQSPGGGSQPAYANYNGSGVAINDGQFAALGLDTLFVGSPLLDISAPLDPVFVAAGTYAVTFAAASTAPLTAGGSALILATLGVQGGADLILPVAETTHPESSWSVNATTAALAGDLVSVAVQNLDGAAQRTFRWFCQITKLA